MNTYLHKFFSEKTILLSDAEIVKQTFSVCRELHNPCFYSKNFTYSVEMSDILIMKTERREYSQFYFIEIIVSFSHGEVVYVLCTSPL